MLRLALVVLLAVAATQARSVSPVRNPLIQHSSKQILADPIPDCGSQGEVLEMRISDCPRAPCEVTIGETYSIEIDFRPMASHEKLTAVASVIQGGTETEFVREDVPAVISPGNSYNFLYIWTVSRTAPKGLIALRFQLLDAGVTEVCALATARVS